MTTIALTLLFATAGLYALASIAFTVLRYGPEALRLRRAIAQVPQKREIHVSITEIRIAARPAAQILRPAFGTRFKPRANPAPAPLRAAA